MKKKNILEDKTFRIFIFIISLIFLTILWINRDSFNSLYKYGYLGIFIFNFVASSSVLFPIPSIATVFVGGAIWNPIIIGVISGVGSSLGELFGYFVGYGGRGLIPSFKKTSHWISKINQLFHRNGFATIFIFSLLPFPFDIVGILAGSLNYSVTKFILAILMARTIRNLVVALSGAKILP